MPPVVLRMLPGFSPNTLICLFACLCVCICRKWAVEGNRAGDCLFKAPDTLWGERKQQVELAGLSGQLFPPSKGFRASLQLLFFMHRDPSSPVPTRGVSCCGSCQATASSFPARGPLAGPAEPGWSPAASSPPQRLAKRSKRHTEKRGRKEQKPAQPCQACAPCSHLLGSPGTRGAF